MKEKIIRNGEILLTSIEQILFGIVILIKSTQIQHPLPLGIDWLDSSIPGGIYLALGLALLFNSLFDFHWYTLRIVLLALSAMMWAMLTVGFGMDSIYSGHLDVLPFMFLTITLRIFVEAFREPALSERGGGHH
ncbi:hypothetical protein PT274_01375 [Leuconostocaceae bacterium ESL0958]|nr:hypothetical protein [Leuconostocaceae bacterium ESL0958]